MTIQPAKPAHRRGAVPRRTLISIAVALAMAQYGSAIAGPSGAQVVAGQIAIAKPDARQTVVTQGTASAIVNWQQFSIARDESVDFRQPNAASVILNRVIGNNPSEIYGRLSANGQVFLINPGGVLFGRTAQVSVGGLVASTLDIANDDFLGGRFRFAAGPGAAGSVVNQGSLQAAERGTVALLGGKVNNDGTISAQLGTAALAAGDKIALDFNGDGLTKIRVDKGAVDAQVANRGLLVADGGQAVMTVQAAQALAATVLNQQGTVQARSLVERDGKILLDGGDSGVTLSSGVLDASGAAPGRHGGEVQVLGHHVGLTGNALVDARGDAGGGAILIGGDAHGANPAVRNAAATFAGPGTALRADATGSGNGGKVIVWSNDATRAFGAISARGGPRSGNGGFIETSGKFLDVAGAAIDAAAPHGKGGNWLLDPYDISIDTTDSLTNVTEGPNFVSFGTGAQIWNQFIVQQLNQGTSVTVTTGGVSTEFGDINVNAPIIKTAGGDASLTLNAARDINVAPQTQVSSNVGKLHVDFNADADGAGGGAITMGVGSAILTNGGNVRFYGQSDPLNGRATGSSFGHPYGISLQSAFIDAGSLTESAPGGNVSLRGRSAVFTQTTSDGATQAAFGGGVALNGTTIRSTSGAIAIDGIGGTGETGVFLESVLLATSAGGAIDVRGRGGPQTTSPSALTHAYGVYADNSSIYTNGGAGDITISGEAIGDSGIFLTLDAGENGNTIGSATTFGNITLRALNTPSNGFQDPMIQLAGRIQTSGVLNLRPGGVSETGELTESPATPINLFSSGGDFALPGTVLTEVIQPESGNVVIGSPNHTGAITAFAGAPFASRYDVTLQNGGAGSQGIALPEGLSNPGYSVTLSSGGLVTQGGPMQAYRLVLHGTQPESSFQLSHPSNSVTELDIGSNPTFGAEDNVNKGDVTFVNSGNLLVGPAAIGSSVNLTTLAAGENAGDIHVFAPILKNDAGDGTLTLNAARDIIVDREASIVAVAPDARLNIDFNADADNANAGGIDVGRNFSDGELAPSPTGAATVIATNGGNVRMYGQSDPLLGRATGTTFDFTNGVALTDTLVDTRSAAPGGGTGFVLMRGAGGGAPETIAGVQLYNSLIRTGAGAVELDGIAPFAVAGVSLTGGLTLNGSGARYAIVTGSGPVSVKGVNGYDGVALSGALVGANADRLGAPANPDGPPAAPITIEGHGGTNGVSLSDGSALGSVGGPIQVTGIGGVNGVALSGSGIFAVDGGSLDIRGRSLLGGADPATGIGVLVQDSVIATGNGPGAIAISGQSDGPAPGILLTATPNATTPTQVGGGVTFQGFSAPTSGDITLRALNAGGGDMIGLNGIVQSTGVLNLRPGGVSDTGQLTDALATPIDLFAATNNFSLNQAELAQNIQPGFASVIIGSSDHTGKITSAGGDLAGRYDVTLLNGGAGSQGMALDGGLSDAGKKVTLSSGGLVTQAAPLVADTLVVYGTRPESNFQLTNPHNVVRRLGIGSDMTPGAANSNSGDVAYVNNGDLALGPVAVGTSVTVTTVVDTAKSVGGDINVDAPMMKTAGGDATLTLNAARDIKVAAGTQIASSSGRLHVNLNAGVESTDTFRSGVLAMESNSSILTNGGDANLYGVSSSNAEPSNLAGVRLNGVNVDTTAHNPSGSDGQVIIRGYGVAIVEGGQTLENSGGVSLLGTSISAGTGMVNLYGAGFGGSAAGAGKGGLDLQGSTLRTTSGSIQLNGFGMGGAGSAGVRLDHSTIVSDSGAITLTGLGSSNSSPAFPDLADSSHGVFMLASTVATTAGGAIDIRGRADMLNATPANGVLMTDSTVTTGGGAGQISIAGESTGPVPGLRIDNTTIGGPATSGDITLLALNATNGPVRGDMIELGGTIGSTGVLNLRPGGVTTRGELADANAVPIDLFAATNNFSLGQAELTQAIQPGFAAVIIGSNAHTGKITSAVGDLAGRYDITLQNGGAGSQGIALDGGLSNAGKKVTLTSGGTVTQGAPIVAASLLLHGTQPESNFQLTDPLNAVGRLSAFFDGAKSTADANSGDVNFVNSGDLDIGRLTGIEIGAFNRPVTLDTGAESVIAGDLVAQAAGKLALNQDIRTLGSDITLVTQSVLDNAGNAKLSPTGGKWIVYADTWNNENRGGLAGTAPYPNLYGCLYGGPCVAAAATGDHFIYRQQPHVRIALDSATPARTYGDPNPPLSFTSTGFVNGDSFGTAVTGDYGTAATPASNVGSYPIRPNFTSPVGYAIEAAPGTLTVNPAMLTYRATPVSRLQDSPNPPLGGSVAGLVAGDTMASATTGTLAFGTPAATNAPPGAYPIDGSGLSAVNYVFRQAPENATALAVMPSVLGFTPTILSAVTFEETTLYGKNFGVQRLCAGTGPLARAGGPTDENDPLASEWARVRQNPNLSNCIGMAPRFTCDNF